jgi:hypothetical protein
LAAAREQKAGDRVALLSYAAEFGVEVVRVEVLVAERSQRFGLVAGVAGEARGVQRMQTRCIVIDVKWS